MFPDDHQQDGPTFVTGSPRDVAVVGAGVVGLATAWFLQEAGVQVTIYERDEIGAGASWGNAGWLTPGLTAPLPEPAVLRYGLRAVLSPRSPVYLPLRADGTLPSAQEIVATRRQVMLQAHILPLIPLAAVFLARGWGA